MAADQNAVEQAVSRTLRDNLEKIQRTADELHQAVNDLVSACASTRASNALPSMLRAQTSAAALSATLDVLSRFVTSAMQAPVRMPFEPDAFRVPSLSPPAALSASFEQPPLPAAHPTEEISWGAPAPVAPPPVSEIPPPIDVPAEVPPVDVPAFAETPRAPEAFAPAEPAGVMEPPAAAEPAAMVTEAPAAEIAAPPEPVRVTVNAPEPEPAFELELPIEPQFEAKPEAAAPAPVERAPEFSLDSLPPEEQELHRRAFRVAKVSMQDIRMLRPEDVRLGRENKDLCFRLRDDIEKAHKEYDRRFQAIQGHPVDYFYDWMVEILGGGDAQTLGEYPYPSPVVRR